MFYSGEESYKIQGVIFKTAMFATLFVLIDPPCREPTTLDSLFQFFLLVTSRLLVAHHQGGYFALLVTLCYLCLVA
jgi:hypothetical protein